MKEFLRKKISVFGSSKKTREISESSILDELNNIKGGKYLEQVEKLRAGDEDVKEDLPMIAFHGLFEGERTKSSFIEATGIVIIDIDDVEDDLEEVKEDIMASDEHVLSAFISPSNTGIKLLYLVDPEMVSVENYKRIGKEISKNFDVYGHTDSLSITDCLIATYDPNLKINLKAYPKIIHLQEIKIEEYDLEKKDESKSVWEDPEEFFETVLLNDIENKSNNNFHFIQIALFDLAKFGFKYPEHDLSFVIQYSESCHKSSKDNERRYIESANIASKMPQRLWPYKLSKKEDEEELVQINLEESDHLIDYSNILDRINGVIEEGDRVGKEISLKNFAEVFRFKGTGILTITGIPGFGKSEICDQILLDLARLYGDASLVVGFEQSPEEHLIKLARKLIGLNITHPSYWKNAANKPIISKAITYITSKIRHIDINKTGGNVDAILKVAKAHIDSEREAGRDVRYFLIDPFNMLSIKGKLSGHEKIEEILRKLTHFSHQEQVLVILVAHPFKMKKNEKTGDYDVPDFYSVKGSSAFFEMSYHGLVVHRKSGVKGTEVLVRVLKVKQNNMGTAGADIYLNYEINSGRYIPIDEEGNELKGDHYDRDWIDKLTLK